MSSNKLMLIVAIVAGFLATVLAFTYISSATKELEQRESEPKVALVFTVNNLPANHILDPDTDLTSGMVGASSSPGLVHAAVKADELESLRGRRINAPVPAGMAILYSHLSGLKDIELAPATRAVSITVNEEGILGGLLVPGDRVDILVSFRKDKTVNEEAIPSFDYDNPQAAIGAILSQVSAQSMDPDHWEVEEILQNVRVIAIDDRLTMSRQQHVFSGEAGLQEIQDAGGPQNVVTLELTPTQAKMLIKARAGGGNYLSLLLRPGSPGVVTRENTSDGS